MPISLSTEARYGWALMISLALHVAVIFAVQVVPKRALSPLPSVLQVRIEQVAAHAMIEPSETRESPPEAPRIFPSPTADPPPALSPAPPAPAIAPVEAPKLLPQVEAPLVNDPTYYPARQVDVHPTALGAILPTYPERAAGAGISGNITLLLLIDESGGVREISVAEANPEGWFEESAIEAFRTARFAPAQRKGQVVKSRVLIRVTYELNSPPSFGGATRR